MAKIKKLIFILLSFFLISISCYAADPEDVVEGIVKEVVLDAIGNVIGYKYVLETGEIWYEFYDEQIDTLIDASNQIVDKANALEDRVIKATDIGGNSGKWRPYRPIPEPSGFYVFKNVKRDSGALWLENYYNVNNLKVFIDQNGYPYFTFYTTGGTKLLGTEVTEIPEGTYTVYNTYGEHIVNGGAQLKTNFYPTNYNITNHGAMLSSTSYCGYGDPETGLRPEDDITNPDGNRYDPTFVPGLDLFNMQFRIYWKDFFDEFDKRIPLFGQPAPGEDGEDGEDGEAGLDGKDGVDAESKKIFDNSLTKITDKVNKIGEDDPGSTPGDDENEVKDESVLTFPFKILKRFVDGVTGLEKKDTIIFPSITWGEYTFNDEMEVSFSKIIADAGLTELHRIYFLLTDAYFTFLLISYAKKKISEFAQGKGDLM